MECISRQLNYDWRAILKLTHIMHVFEVWKIWELYHQWKVSSKPWVIGSSSYQMINKTPKFHAVINIELFHIEKEHSNVDPTSVLDAIRVDRQRHPTISYWFGLIKKVVIKYLFVELAKTAQKIKNIEKNISWFNARFKPWVAMSLRPILVLYSFPNW